jgi:hypothetical protein
MITIKNAVNDNDTRINGVIANTQEGALKTAVDANTAATAANAAAITAINGTNTTQNTDITNLKGNLANGNCVVGSGDDADGMVRIGSICVDKFQARADFSGCSTDGSTGCTTVAAASTAAGTAASNMTWAQAARACANAGKRLLAPGEWMMARSFGDTVLSGDGMFTDTYSEWVDSVQMITDIMGVGRMGPNIGSAASGVVGYQAVDQVFELPGATVGFRCAR